jgi:hypothetical protein
MILLPQSDQSLSGICSELPDAFYGLPRFELPEWLWERLPRSDPRRAMAEVERLGRGLRLDEPTVSHEWIRFDAPGDFQLILREDFLAIDGLDEEMLLGYHVDSNLSRRMFFDRGPIESHRRQPRGLPLQPQPRAHRLPRQRAGRERSRSVRREGRSA